MDTRLRQQRSFRCGPELIEIAPHAKDDLFRIKYFAGGGGRAVLGAAAALDAAVGLKGDELGDVLAGYETKVFDCFVGREGWDFAEAIALEKDGDWG